MDAVIRAAEAKGWGWEITAKDVVNFRYATVSVQRYLGEYVTAIFEITCDRVVKLNAQKTSFYGHGVDDLRDAAWNEINRLPWLQEKKRKKRRVISVRIKSKDSSTTLEKLSPDCSPTEASAQWSRSFLDGRRVRHPRFASCLAAWLFDDVRSEEYAPSYAGGASRIDFLLKAEGIAIEVKMASSKLRDKQVGEQLLVDIARYQAHSSCTNLVCFVYDPDANIKNPAGLEADLSRKHGTVSVKVILVSPS